jgi:predicted dehydrogenase
MKRRQFIHSTLAAAGMAAIPGLAATSRDPLEGQLLRTGLIGTGRQGRKHLRLAGGLPGYDIHTICDVLPFQLDEAKKLVGPGTRAVEDYRYILDDTDIDAVIIATPFHLHAKPMLDALDAGKHVYCEKTLVKGHEQIAEVSEAVSGTDRIIQAGYQHRYSNLLQKVASLIEHGSIGEISKIECQWNRNGDWRRPVPAPEYERLVNWRMYREYSGGLAAELSSHQMDIVEWIMDTRPASIMGTGGVDYWKDGRETRDNIHLLVKYENGVTASYSSLTTNAHEGFRMTFLGTKGTIVTSLEEAWVSTDGKGEDAPEGVDAVSGATMYLGSGPGYRIKPARFNPTRNALAGFRESVLSNTTPAASVDHALITARTVQLSLDAMDSGSVVSF